MRIPGLALVPHLSLTGSLSHTQHWAWLLSCWPWHAKHVSQQISDPSLSQAWRMETWSWMAVLTGGWGYAVKSISSIHHVSPHIQGTLVTEAGISHYRMAWYCGTLTCSTCGTGLHFHIWLHHIFFHCLSGHWHLEPGIVVSSCCLSFVGSKGTRRILHSSERQRWQQPEAGHLQAMLQKPTALNTLLLN